MASSSRVQLEAWIARKDVSGMVLDIGGAQEPLKSRIGQTMDTTFHILDLPEPHELKVRPEIEADLNFPILDENHLLRERYDTVACLEVTEYFWNPVVAIANMAYFLKPGGRLLISFHFLYPVHAPEGLDLLRYTEFGAKTLLNVCGFEVVECVDRMASDYKVYPWDVFNAAEKTHPLKRYDHRKIGCLIEAKKK